MAGNSELSATQPFIVSIDDPRAKRTNPQRFIVAIMVVIFACVLASKHPDVLTILIVSSVVGMLEFFSTTRISCAFDPAGKIAQYKTQKVIMKRFTIDYFRTKIIPYSEIVDIAVWMRTDGVFSVYMRQRKANHRMKEFSVKQDALAFAEALKEVVGNARPIAEQEGKFMLYYPVE